MIIEKWANIDKNYFNSDLDYTETKSEKIDLTKVFKYSIDEIKKSDISTISITTLLKANICANDRLEKAYNSFSILQRIFFQLCKFLKIHAFLFYYYHLFIDELASQVAKKYQNNFKGLIDTFEPIILNKEKFSKINQKFIEKIISKAKDNLYKRINTTGIIYEINNQFNCKSYIIGTLHLDLSISPLILEKVQQSDQLFVEVIPSEIINFLHTIPPCCKGNIVDISLIQAARKNKISVHALESHSDAMRSIPKSVLKEIKSNPYYLPNTKKVQLHCI